MYILHLSHLRLVSEFYYVGEQRKWLGGVEQERRKGMTGKKGEIYEFRSLGETSFVTSVHKDVKKQGKRVSTRGGNVLIGDLTNFERSH